MPRRTAATDVADLIQAIGLLMRRIRAAAASHELSLTESAVLARLSRQGPATTAELSRAESVRPQSMATTIAALEDMGLVERKPHLTDGRQMNIALTSKGAAVRNNMKDAKHTWLAAAIAELDPEDQQTLIAAGRIIRRVAESEQKRGDHGRL